MNATQFYWLEWTGKKTSIIFSPTNPPVKTFFYKLNSAAYSPSISFEKCKRRNFTGKKKNTRVTIFYIHRRYTVFYSHYIRFFRYRTNRRQRNRFRTGLAYFQFITEIHFGPFGGGDAEADLARHCVCMVIQFRFSLYFPTRWKTAVIFRRGYERVTNWRFNFRPSPERRDRFRKDSMAFFPFVLFSMIRRQVRNARHSCTALIKFSIFPIIN